MVHENREVLVNGIVKGMAPLFEAMGIPVPSRVRVAIGFTSTGTGERMFENVR